MGNYAAAHKAGASEELDSKTKDAAALWLEGELKRAEQRSPVRGADLLATVAAVEALAARHGVAGRVRESLSRVRKRGGELLWAEQKAQLTACTDRDPFTCQGQLLALLAALPAEAADARREVETERTARNRVFAPRFARALAEAEGHPGARVVALRMLAALGEQHSTPPMDAAKLPAKVAWVQTASGCPELADVARVSSGSGARRAELRIDGSCDKFDRRTSRTETESWTEQEQRETTSTQSVCRDVSEHVGQCTCSQYADINGSGYKTCISYLSCDRSRTVCEPQTTTKVYTVDIPRTGSYTVSSRTVGASLRATAVADFEGRSFSASFSDGTSQNETSYQSHNGSSSFSNASDEALLAGYKGEFAERVAGVVRDVEQAAAAAALRDAAGKNVLDSEDLVVAASLVPGAVAASEGLLAPLAARLGVSVAMYQRFLGADAPSFAPSFAGSADLGVPHEDADLIAQSEKHDEAVAEDREEDQFIEKMHGFHGSALLAGTLSAGTDDKNTGGGAAGLGLRTSLGTRFFVPIDGAVRIGYDGGAKAWNTQSTLLAGLGLRNSRASASLLGAVGASGFGAAETGRYYLPFGLDAGYGLESSLRITGGHFLELQALRLHRPKNERGAGQEPVRQTYRGTVRYTYRNGKSSSSAEYGVLVECNLVYETSRIIPDRGTRGRNCTAGIVLAF